MKKYFDKQTLEFLQERGAALLPGMQAHYNHEGCPAGEDLKNRLYVKVTDDGRMVLGFCHHCGRRGGLPTTGHWRKGLVPKTGTEIDPNRGNAWHVMEEGYMGATPVQEVSHQDFYHGERGLVMNSQLKHLIPAPSPVIDLRTVDMMYERGWYGMRATPILTLYIPYESDIGLVGLDTRNDSPYGNGKWVRYKKLGLDGKPLAGKIVIYNFNRSNICVIVEDPISAMKVDLAGYAGVSLMGNTCDTETLLKLSNLFDRCVVWLDNDSPLIRANVNDIVKRARMFFDAVEAVSTKTDPKRYSIAEIKGVVN